MTSSRITVRLALGILCGIALVLLPTVFSTGTSTASSSANWFPAGGAQPALGFNNSSGLSFLAIVFVIFLPSAIFSFVVRRWAERRARDYLNEY